MACSPLLDEECRADLSSDTRDFRRAFSAEIWDGDSCSATVGLQHCLPLRPQHCEPAALQGQVSA